MFSKIVFSSKLNVDFNICMYQSYAIFLSCSYNQKTYFLSTELCFSFTLFLIILYKIELLLIYANVYRQVLPWRPVLRLTIKLMRPRIISINRARARAVPMCYTTLRRLAHVRWSRLSMDIVLAPRAVHTCDVLTARQPNTVIMSM